jgi:hypothetical protein
MFVEQNEGHLIKAGKPLRRIHVAHIDRAPKKVVAYALKAIEHRIPDSNQMLVLPKALSELPDKPRK